MLPRVPYKPYNNNSSNKIQNMISAVEWRHGPTTKSTWMAPETATVTTLWCLCLGLFVAQTTALNVRNISVVSALLAYSYTDSQTGELVQTSRSGHYGAGSVVVNGSGYLVHVRVNGSGNLGCTPYVNSPSPIAGPWISLVRRGGCKFQKKVDVALYHNASAIVIYNHEPEDTGSTVRELFVIKTTTIATVFIQHADGTALAALVDNGTEVYLTIVVGSQHIIDTTNETFLNVGGPSRHTTAVLLTFVGFLIVGLVIVVVYAVRHAKYVHARNQATLAVSLHDTQQAHEVLLNNSENLRQQAQSNQVSQSLILQLQQQHQQRQQSLQQQQQQQHHPPQNQSRPARVEPATQPTEQQPAHVDDQSNSMPDPHDQSIALLPH